MPPLPGRNDWDRRSTAVSRLPSPWPGTAAPGADAPGTIEFRALLAPAPPAGAAPVEKEVRPGDCGAISCAAAAGSACLGRDTRGIDGFP
mmetsp:Transcript_46135/g.98573  ORF Transcript_46135/g.98573 Transcript_46135/m.98573 type:complete len:90 (-) Transcript_46135:600-869(-)